MLQKLLELFTSYRESTYGFMPLILAQNLSNNDLINNIVNYGVLGLVVFALITRKFVTGGELNDYKAQVAKLEAKIEKLENEKNVLHEAIKEEILPKTFAATQAMTQFAGVTTDLVTKIQEELRRASDAPR